LVPDFVDHVLDPGAGIPNQVGDGKQDLFVGLAELLDNGSGLPRGAGHDVVTFFAAAGRLF